MLPAHKKMTVNDKDHMNTMRNVGMKARHIDDLFTHQT